MIISRTPLRITLGGGGTDDPAFVAEYGGFCLTAAISKHVYIGVNDTFEPGYLLKYSEIEHVETVDGIKHPIIREAIRYFDIPPHVEIVSLADIPAGTGLGSSAAFTVGLCSALAAYRNFRHVSLAETAAEIELGILKRPGGQQDHWATALGGVLALTFEQTGAVKAEAIQVGSLLEKSLALFFTGFARDSEAILARQSRVGLQEIKVGGWASQECLLIQDVRGYGELMHEHWRAKKTRSSQITNDRIDHLYEAGIANGAIGGKLVGAGGGGFLLFVTEDQNRLAEAMRQEGAAQVPIQLDHSGSVVIAGKP